MDPMTRAKELIEHHIPDAVVEVTDLTGGRDHVGLLVASDAFQGKMLIEQHQMIMDILKEELAGELHAIQIKTITKASRKESV